MALLITGVAGAAARAGITPGGRLVAINGEPVLDFVDYSCFSALPSMELAVDYGQDRRHYSIGKRQEEPLGLDLEGLYPDERRCANRCVFCFVDQMPMGLRESLYVKDDDWRYSALFGNYVTLTNVPDREFERLIRRAPSPLYVSVHATDPAVRAKLTGNPAAVMLLEQLKRLTAAKITVHCQVVLVPDWNDGEVLRQTLLDLYGLYPGVRTVAVVPLGLTCHRQGLAQLRPVGLNDAAQAVETVRHIERQAMREKGIRFAFAADELIERAGLPAQRYADGEHAPQLANGVGLVSGLLDEFEWALGELPERLPQPREVTITTGVSAYGLMVAVSRALMDRVRNLRVHVLKVENRLFGPRVTVAGLLCGADIARAASGMPIGGTILIPQAALRRGEDIFLDGMTVNQLADALGAPVQAVPCDGAALAYAACGLEEQID